MLMHKKAAQIKSTVSLKIGMVSFYLEFFPQMNQCVKSHLEGYSLWLFISVLKLMVSHFIEISKSTKLLHSSRAHNEHDFNNFQINITLLQNGKYCLKSIITVVTNLLLIVWNTFKSTYIILKLSQGIRTFDLSVKAKAKWCFVNQNCMLLLLLVTTVFKLTDINFKKKNNVCFKILLKTYSIIRYKNIETRFSHNC